MKASKFTDAQKAFVIKQGEERRRRDHKVRMMPEKSVPAFSLAKAS